MSGDDEEEEEEVGDEDDNEDESGKDGERVELPRITRGCRVTPLPPALRLSLIPAPTIALSGPLLSMLKLAFLAALPVLSLISLTIGTLYDEVDVAKDSTEGRKARIWRGAGADAALVREGFGAGAGTAIWAKKSADSRTIRDARLKGRKFTVASIKYV